MSILEKERKEWNEAMKKAKEKPKIQQKQTEKKVELIPEQEQRVISRLESLVNRMTEVEEKVAISN